MNSVSPFESLQPIIWWRIYVNLERELKSDCPIMYFIIVFRNVDDGRLLKANKWLFFFSIFLFVGGREMLIEFLMTSLSLKSTVSV